MDEKMKTVQYRGKSYEVPEWVKWIATDLDGDFFGFENKPMKSYNFWLKQEGRKCKLQEIYLQWEETLESV